jgi:sulfide dehydrogenase [flavocytochrome c] flavoprotein subunit
MARPSRRELGKLLAAVGVSVAAAPVLGRFAIAQAAPKVVIVGGGAGGATVAHYLSKRSPDLDITLIEANPIYSSAFFSNHYLGGIIRSLESLNHGYGGLQRLHVKVLHDLAVDVNPVRKTVRTRGGRTYSYDRLVLSPGIEFRAGAIPGYDSKAAAIMPAAWNNGDEVALLRRQLEAMDDGGTVVITSPVNPARCPPAPYERASLIAHYLKTKKPRSKVIVLDSKEGFTMQKLFDAAWKELYPGMIEWVGLSNGGALSSVDAGTKTLLTDFDRYQADVANVIPPQKAGHAADLAGVADRTGWCPVDPVTFESRLQKNIHVVGDAAIAGAMPRSASAAHSQGTICAAAIVALLAGKKPEPPALISSCYSLIAPDYAISQRGTYRPVDDQYAEADGGAIVSAPGASRNARKDEAGQAHAWYRTITGEVFG